MIEFSSLFLSPLMLILSFIALIIGLFLVFFIIIPLRKVNSRKQDGVNTYFFPILGYFNVFEKALAEKGDVLAYAKEFDNCISNCKVLSTHLVRTPLLVLKDPQYIKEYLYKHNCYVKSDMFESIKVLCKNGLVFSEGETWKRHRKIISSSFNFEFLKTKIEGIQKTAQEFLGKLSAEDCSSYSAIRKVQEITGEVVGRIFFGEHLNSYTFEGKSLTLALADISAELASIGMTPLFMVFGPKILKSRLVPRCRKIMERVRNFHKLCHKIVQDIKAKPQPEANDLLSSLLATQKSQDSDNMFSDNDIVDEFITFFAAGMDTTGHLIGMTLYNLSQHPEYLPQLQKERDNTYNKEQPLTADVLTKMDLLHAFLKETLRFHTPAPLTFVREVMKDHELLDIKVKKGELVFPEYLTSAFDKKNFENPQQFNPARWMHSEHKIDPYAFLPFSAGPRNCVGQHLALMEAKIILSEFLERFDFELEKDYKLKMTFTFLYEPEKELRFKLTPKV